MKRGKIRKVLKVWLVINLLANIGYADIKVDKGVQQNTRVDRAQNGANIININTPNSKGISVNDYSEFKTKDPTVFNNFGSGVGRSYLAGMMASNPNLSKEQYARLILNRVNGAERAERGSSVFSEKSHQIYVFINKIGTHRKLFNESLLLMAVSHLQY